MILISQTETWFVPTWRVVSNLPVWANGSHDGRHCRCWLWLFPVWLHYYTGRLTVYFNTTQWWVKLSKESVFQTILLTDSCEPIHRRKDSVVVCFLSCCVPFRSDEPGARGIVCRVVPNWSDEKRLLHGAFKTLLFYTVAWIIDQTI